MIPTQATETGGVSLRTIGVTSSDARALRDGEHYEPHRILGAHPFKKGRRKGVMIRAFHPDAKKAVCILEDNGEQFAMDSAQGGLFACFLPDAAPGLVYRIRFFFSNGSTFERIDPYRFLPTIGEQDLHYFNEGTHRELWSILGAHPRRCDGVDGVAFAVWAPNAKRVSVVGDFCGWDGRLYPMRSLGSSGVFELFIPGVPAGSFYKFELVSQSGRLQLRADPFAFECELRPSTASRVHSSSYVWNDASWLESRRHKDLFKSPLAIYEVHLSSWARVPEDGDRFLSYREVTPRLIEHAKKYGFTHLELMAIAEYPFDGSWGYQVTGYYAPTSRYGSPDDFRFLVDECHKHGIGVLIDWVPAHFPRDDFALAHFDGTCLFEYEDPRLGQHPDWGTMVFNYGRREVRNFLVANALFWLKEYHLDGLRVDAVSSMLYRDYSRPEGEWLPNHYGGRENLEAISFFQEVNSIIRNDFPGCITVAEESTSWGGVTNDTQYGGLGFSFKWNMGWMHDTLEYFKRDPIYRKHHQNELTFAQIYEYSECFIMPLSHDEVVHGKCSLYNKMPGDPWQKLANLRLLLAYQYFRPGKKLLFMGTELAPYDEWDYQHSLDWHLLNDPKRKAFSHFLETMGKFYLASPCLWQRDHDSRATQWIDTSDEQQSVVSFMRRSDSGFVVVVLNLTPTPRDRYLIGMPAAGKYQMTFCTDWREFGGSGYESETVATTQAIAMHGQAQSIEINLPPLCAMVLEPR
ncbi:MAG: 1,4-alpha-glucan branching protein GlgB [Myxococcales bacterium]|nr:MAG: 1,4-alpha-glucan branching protein GlgB [Myxococcales bacterium]